MGKADATLFTERLVVRHQPGTVVSIGIAQSLKSDVKIGDVALAAQIDDYLYRDKAVADDQDFKHGGIVFRSNHHDIARLTNFEFVHPAPLAAWATTGGQDAKNVLTEQDLASLAAHGVWSNEPRFHADEIHLACGDVVGADTEFTRWLHRRDRNLQVLEMESAGVLRAITARATPLRSLVLRGISDSTLMPKAESDELSEGAARGLAMRNAVRFALTLMDHGVVPVRMDAPS